MKKSTIYCKTTSKGVQSFYANVHGQDHFLFSQNYRTGVRNYFIRPKSIDKALDFSCANGDFCLVHTMEKLPSYIRYIEREYGIEVLDKTRRKNERARTRAA